MGWWIRKNICTEGKNRKEIRLKGEKKCSLEMNEWMFRFCSKILVNIAYLLAFLQNKYMDIFR